jgi:tetratricopeptide (TPR) repeat protein
VRAYREVVTGIATSPDPRKQKALQRFADGEQREALADFDMIADANRAARVKAIDIADAADRRPAAWLALQAHDKGTVTLEEVVRRYEHLTRLDPGMTLDWILLARLYDEQGRLDEAKKAAQSAYTSLAGGGDERDRSVVLNELGNIAVKAGELKEAKARFEEGLLIARKLAKDNLTSAAAQRDLSVSLNQLGDVAVQAGDLKNAKACFEESVLIDRKLAEDNPTSAVAQRDLSVSLSKLGDVAVKAGEIKDAKARFKEALLIRNKLAKDNPTSAEAQRDLSVSFHNLGVVAVQAGDLKDAKARFEESLLITRKLAKDNPTSAVAQRDLLLSLGRLGQVAGDRQLLREALEITRELERTGRLAPSDHYILDLIPKVIESIQ